MQVSQLKDENRERRSFSTRTLGLFLVALLMVGVLLGRLLQLQVWEYDTYQTRSDDNRIQVQPIAPPRGRIYDRNGELLADNQPVWSLALVRENLADVDEVVAELGGLIEINDRDVEEFHKRLERRRRPFEPVALKLNLTEEEVAVIRVNSHRLPGVEVMTETVRHYPFGELLAHAVGSVRRVTEEDLQRLDPVRYSGTTFVGKRGVEAFYEASLHGDVGHRQVEVDVRGRVLRELEVSRPMTGQNMTLHLDSRLQIAAHGALGNRRGSIVAIDPKSGGILAMVSRPGYDPNLFVMGMTGDQYKEMTQSRDLPLFNRASRGQYAPGSTFKPIVGLAAITYGVTTWEETIEDRGWFKLPNQERIYRDWSWTRNNSGGQGTVDLNRAIYRSSNVYFYDLATRLEGDALQNFAQQFGYGRVTSVDVDSAAPGVLPDSIWKRGHKGEPWYPGDTVNMSIGQGDLLVTPLQLATVASLIANRGRWVRPRMLLSSDSDPEGFDPPPPIPDVTGPRLDDWERMIDSMEDVVHRGNKGYGQNGTAWAYIGQKVPYRIAGKSGTAQLVEIRQGEEYDEDELDEYQRKHAWFMAFAPADDPAIALAVLVENGGGGSSVAGPVAREVLDAYLLPQLALTKNTRSVNE